MTVLFFARGVLHSDDGVESTLNKRNENDLKTYVSAADGGTFRTILA